MGREANIKKAVEAFLMYPNFSMKQLSVVTGFSASSVQRYLNDSIIASLFSDDVAEKIALQIQENAQDARVKGGINSFLNTVPIQDESGHFIGNVKYVGRDNRLAKKSQHLLFVAAIFLSHPDLTLTELTEFCNQFTKDDTVYTRDYVYDCLTASYRGKVLGSDTIEKIDGYLERNQHFGAVKGAIVTNSRRK